MKHMPTPDMLAHLQSVVGSSLNRHLSTATEWFPHEFVPYEEGRNFLDEPWKSSDSHLDDVAQTALEVNFLTEDNLPYYHLAIWETFGGDGPWAEWIRRWTAEEGRHAIVLRDYLTVTRGIDPVALERGRMDQVGRGYYSADGMGPLDGLVYTTLQELATRISHRNTGRFTEASRSSRPGSPWTRTSTTSSTGMLPLHGEALRGEAGRARRGRICGRALIVTARHAGGRVLRHRKVIGGMIVRKREPGTRSGEGEKRVGLFVAGRRCAVRDERPIAESKVSALPHSPRTSGSMREVVGLRCPSCESTRILVVLGPNPRASCRDCGCRWVQEGSEQISIRRPGEISVRARHPSHRRTGGGA